MASPITSAVYLHVIEDVINKVRDDFALSDGPDETVLEMLQRVIFTSPSLLLSCTSNRVSFGCEQDEFRVYLVIFDKLRGRFDLISFMVSDLLICWCK